MNLALRSIAILIAIAGAIDPAWSVGRPVLQELIAIRMASTPSPEIEQSLRKTLPGWNVVFRESAQRVPCAAGERCVVLADGSIEAAVPSDLAHPMSLIKMTTAGGPNVAIRIVSVSRTHQAGSGLARVELSAEGVGGKESQIRLLDGAAVVGSASHKWSAATAVVDIPWWPIQSGARVLRVEAVPIDGEVTSLDNQLDVGVNVETERSPVMVFDARPSWNSAFIRRALEDDLRFTVGYRARLAPSLSAGTVNGTLDAATLDKVSVAIIGGPDALTEGDVQLLDHYVRVRGGTLILLPERIPAAPSASLFGGSWSEHLIAAPESVGVLRATEILRLDKPTAASTVLARSGPAGAIVLVPSGNGRVIVSGAMDAWRYREQTGFDAFWRSLIAESAMQGSALQLRFDRDLARSGSRVRFTLRDLRMTPAIDSESTATVTCGDAPASVVRLWPAGEIGEFMGEVPLPPSGSCEVDASVGDRHVAGAVAAAERPMLGLARTLSNLERDIKAAGGVVASAGNEAAVANAIQRGASLPPVMTAVHPMRSAWWIVPFAGCLSAEWWLRRRNGLR